MYYLSSENKGADQLCCYREADLRLCFCMSKNPVFSHRGSNNAAYATKEVETLSNRNNKSYKYNLVIMHWVTHSNINAIKCTKMKNN